MHADIIICLHYYYDLNIISLPSLPSSVLSLPPNVEGALESQGLPSTVPSIPPDGNDVPAPMRSDSEVHHDSDMDLEMPTDVPEDDGRPKAFDDCEDLDDPDIDDELNQMELLDLDLIRGVPKPSVAAQLSTTQDIAEYYSPPRVLPVARQHGQRGCLSLDVMTGWDFNSAANRDLSRQCLAMLHIMLFVLSPPCTAFSELQRLWNYKRMTAEAIHQQWAQGMLYLRHSMDCAMDQVRQGAYFAFEHPARASSWGLPEVQRVLSQPGVVVVTFDQCMLGLTSKVHGIPTRKRTKIATNCPALAQRFASPCCRCDRSHIHQTIQGSEGGLRRSIWAQMYTPGKVDLLARPW